ncbi:PucR family transcriptional regulator [Paenibacillus eucommiae]|uniref:Purine catabolism regulator n=1 Tax=Paenibacillus eucommiae TaxID=1355755 RepID=A0ABS4INA2_9BACL|nr:PucR family transcriptional regulator [Paenibacillus eucommiae]MBP1989014.1 purine catabolism regulator [Paenibacillus eucommiae]
MKLIDALQLSSFQHASLVAGANGLERAIRWVHVVDLPDPLPWVRAGDLLLTTGYAWPTEAEQQRKLIYALAERGLAGVGLAVPQFLPKMPAPACAAADEIGFPLFEIPWEVPFTSITEEIHNSILTIHYKLQEQSEAIHRELMRTALEAEGLQDIVTTLGKLLGRTVTIELPEGSLLAAYYLGEQLGHQDQPEQQDHKEQQIPYQAAKRHEANASIEQQRYLKTLRAGGQHLHIPAAPELGLPERFVCPIHINREMVGLLWVFEEENPLNELDIRTVQYAAIIMALHISQQRALASLEAQLGYSFLDSLLEGHFNPTSQALKRAQIFGFDPNGIYRVGILVLNAQVPLSREAIAEREHLAELLRRQFQEFGTPPLLSLTQNQIIFLLPEPYKAEQIWEPLKASTISLAVSRAHRGFAAVQQAYNDVRAILPHLIPGQYHDYDELLVPLVLTGDKEARASFLEKLFAPLKAAKNGEVLIQTLLMLARTGFHLKRTAEELCIHPKTLRYRMDRLVKLGAYDLHDAETQFNLQLAIRLLSLEE